ncbi:MAG: zinc ribbon domain-containing protein [Planctomycetota bacterium]
MYCWNCGAENDDNNFRCVKCGEVIQQLAGRPAPAQRIGDDAGMRLILPVGRSGFAIAAGYAGLFSLLLLPAPLALLLGILAIVDIRRHPDKHGMGRAVFGILMGVLGMAALALILLMTFLQSR